MRAKAEADLECSSKFCDHLQEALNKVKAGGDTYKPAEKVNEKCRNVDKHGGCKYGEQCNYIHPVKICKYFVTMGSCQLGKDCMDSHSKKEREAFLSKENKVKKD